jgi:hypothetical protein
MRKIKFTDKQIAKLYKLSNKRTRKTRIITRPSNYQDDYPVDAKYALDVINDEYDFKITLYGDDRTKIFSPESKSYGRALYRYFYILMKSRLWNENEVYDEIDYTMNSDDYFEYNLEYIQAIIRNKLEDIKDLGYTSLRAYRREHVFHRIW